MATMYDAPMQDFSQDNTMDTDVLPSASSDIDWLQAESMMEDGDSQKPLQPEIDMNHDDLQEYEMRDADAEYAVDFDQVTSEEPRPELQDEEIPDASRAPSPGVGDAIQLQMQQPFSRSVNPDPGSDQPVQQDGENAEAPGETIQFAQNLVAHKSDEVQEESTTHLPNVVEEQISPGEISNESTTHPPNVVEEQISPGDVGNASASDVQDNATISGESTTSSQVQQHHKQQEQEQEPPEQEHATELPEHSDVPETLNHGEIGPYEGDANEEHVHPNGEVLESTTENQVFAPEDYGLLMDPPPSVSLFCALDNSRFTLFNPLEISTSADIPAATASEVSYSAPDDQTEHESHPKHEVSEGHQTLSELDNPVSGDSVLLFHERFALYYEPLCLIFEALRSESDFNVDGRFDDNVELVISAPELDLTLPEDNINSREVSLHDLNILHNGCELTGPLSLRLDTISPRFGTRYKAIRDEIFRVVSQQEEQEQQSRLDPGEEYYADLPLHDSPENHADDAHPRRSQVEDDRPGTSADVAEAHAEPLESRSHDEQYVNHGSGASGSHESEESPQIGHSDNLASEEYLAAHNDPHIQDDVERHDTDEGYAGEGREENAEEGEDLDGEYDGEYDGEDDLYDDIEDLEQQPNDTQSGEGQQEGSFPSDYHGEPLGTLGPSDAFDDSADASDDRPQVVTEDPAQNLEATSIPSIQPEGVASSDEPGSTITDHLELQADYAGSASQYVSPKNALSDTGPLSTDERSLSRHSTPHQSPHDEHGQDELIAYEDAVKDTKPSQTWPADISKVDSGAVSTSSKRSYDELEPDHVDGVDIPHDASTDSKRLRTD